MREFVTYALSDPETGETRYVGKTCQGIDVRLNEHRYNAKAGKRTHLYCWLRSLAAEPACTVLGKYESEAAMNDGEKALIAQYRISGRLVNHVDGGEGVSGWKHSAETKARIAASISARERKPLTAEQRRRVSASKGGRIVVDENGVKYVSANAAAVALNINSGGVSRSAANDGYYRVAGHTFKYAEQGA